MIECPVCGKSFSSGRGVIYLNEEYCSPPCAAKAAEEGRDANEPAELEQA